MHSTSTSLKLAVGALAVASAIFGLTGCGSHAKQKLLDAPTTMSGSSSAQFDAGHTVE
jgi:hypothetical protein